MFSYIVLVLYIANIFGVDVLATSRGNYCSEIKHGMMLCNYIPREIPDGISKVSVLAVQKDDIVLNETTFIETGWDKIKYLELLFNADGTKSFLLNDNCFYGLRRLQVLKMRTKNYISFTPESFSKLNKVEILDMTGCSRLRLEKFIQAINGSTKLPMLNKLSISYCCVFKQGQISVNENMLEVLGSKRISDLDISGLPFSFINLTLTLQRLTYLKVINMSQVTLGDFYSKGLEQSDLKRIKSIDLSYITLSKKTLPFFPGTLTISNVKISLSGLENYNDFALLFSPGSINATGIVPHLSMFWIKNVTINIDRIINWKTKSLILRKNNLRRLDIILTCDKYKLTSLQHVDISENRLDFISPGFISCIPYIKYVDLSKNTLSNMAKENVSLFELLFSNGKFLTHINLSYNKLKTIPFKMFKYNRNVRTIDLSHNELEQVHFDLSGLYNLEVLNLQSNNILILDRRSIDNLNSITNGNGKNISKTTIILTLNPLSCSKCKTKHFLTWIIATNLVNLTSQELKCTNGRGILQNISEYTEKEVQKMCQMKTIIKTTSALAGLLAFTIIAVSTVMYLKRKRKRKLENRENVLELLRKGEGRYKFAVFLAFSNKDEDFVNQHIRQHLNENLQLMTGLDRELVCTGDQHFRPGFYVHNEGFRALDMASVVIVVASNNFCQSSYCMNELDQAYVKRKPIVLMVIESIASEIMVPTMREIFQRNVRILWTLHNGEYKMKTTWENVCTSLLDLMEI